MKYSYCGRTHGLGLAGDRDLKHHRFSHHPFGTSKKMLKSLWLSKYDCATEMCTWKCHGVGHLGCLGKVSLSAAVITRCATSPPESTWLKGECLISSFPLCKSY